MVNPSGRAGRQVRVVEVAEKPGYDPHFEREKFIADDLHYFSSCIAGSLLTLVPEDLEQVQVGSQHYYLNIRSKQQNLKVLACFN